jgi:ABC-type Fe3+/spermidine/putrescine transport system ATPase subunit
MLVLKNISFSYGNKVTLKANSIFIAKGQNVAVIGESGCGKSTLLKLIYGLHDLDEGQIFWKESEVLGPKFHLIPGMPFMKYLAQDFDLMPYVTVAENVGKFLSNFYPEQKKKRIHELLEIVEMTQFAAVKARYLSGGQMQRVAIARVLALEPEVLLLDEPFSHIDNFRKNSLRRKVFGYLKEKEITCIIATHDSKDILSYTDETIVIQNGEIIAKDFTKKLYQNPQNRYVASLFDEVNEIPVAWIENSNTSKGNLLIYPYQLKVVSKSNFKVKVKNSFFKGNGYLIESICENQKIYFENADNLKIGEDVFLSYQK